MMGIKNKQPPERWLLASKFFLEIETDAYFKIAVV
jgi:hypothetical protein